MAQRGRKFWNHSVIELLTCMSQSPLAETIAVCARSSLFRIALLVFIGLVCDFAVAQYVPTPRPRPVQGQGEPSDAISKPHETSGPSACRLHLTSEFAVAPSLPPITGPGECGADDVVRLEAVVLPDKTRVAISPPAIVRCILAETLAHWVRDDLAPAARSLGAPLESIQGHTSYECRGRNRAAGTKLSEHGKANALDLHSLRLSNGTVLILTDPHLTTNFREAVRKSACARFMTVLGPGSDVYHEDHVHVDLRERRNGYRMCQWDVREPGEEPTVGISNVPLRP